MARRPDTPEQKEQKRLFKEQELADRVRKNRKAVPQSPAEPMAEESQNPTQSAPAPEPPAQASSTPPPPATPPDAPAPTAAPSDDTGPLKPEGNPQPITDYNPLTESDVIQRSYSTPTPLPDGTKPIPEPAFEMPKLPPPSSSGTPGTGSIPGAPGIATPGAGSANPIIPPMQSMQNLPPDERRTRAAQAVDMTLGFYDRLHQFARWYVAMQPEKVDELCMQGKLSLDIQIPMDAEGHRFLSVGDFIAAYNKQSAEALTLDPKFKNEVREPMIRVFDKNGWGASDEMFLAAKFSEDIAIKGSMLVGFKMSMKKQMSIFTDFYTRGLTKNQPAGAPPAQEKAEEPEEKTANTTAPEEKQPTSDTAIGTGGEEIKVVQD